MKTETRVGLFILVAIAIFLYLSINIKALRFDKHQYYTYKAYFDDTGGLTVKSYVKIAGVDVGWVDAIELLDNGKAEVIMRISKTNKLAKNAYAMIHQSDLIGTKALEIDPGDPSTGLLLPGSTLSMPGKTPASVGELLDQVRDIAATVQDVTSAFKNVFATHRGEENMRMALNAVSKATERLADFSETLQKTMQQNADTITKMIADFRATAESLKTGVPEVKDKINMVATTIDESGKKAGAAFEQIEDAAIQTKDTLKEAGQVMEKINTGKGVVGKLINEDETYGDLKKTIKGFKDYVGKTQSLMLNIDMHSETMLRQTNDKGYFELRLRPNSDFFYLLQLVGAEKGGITRDTSYYTRYDDKGNLLKASDITGTDAYAQAKRVELAHQVEQVKQRKNDILFGLQFGKRFDRLAFRIGLFENTVGFGCDFYIPLQTDSFHWITSFEAFDFSGVNRLDDSRPHLKWINKTFFLRNLYTTFGIDDFCSKHNANPFVGGGLRFGDDDLKYFMSYLPVKK